MKRLVLGVLLLGTLIAVVQGYTALWREQTYTHLVDEGEAALARDDAYAAIEAFSGAIALKDDSMLGYLRRGEAYRRLGELESALRDLRRATELDPAALQAQEQMGDVQALLGRHQRAAERYAQYATLDDRSARVFYKLALAQYRAGWAREAIESADRALALDERLAEAHYVRGLALRDSQRFDQATAALERAVALAPALLYAREELAALQSRRGQGAGRLAQLEALLALDPRPAREVELGLALAREGQIDRAVLTIGRTVERHPGFGPAHVALGRVWLQAAQGRRDPIALNKALAALERAAAADNTSEAFALLGRALLLSADVEAAERALSQALARRPTYPLAYLHYAEAAERRGHLDEARRALVDYHALRGDDADARRRAGLAARIADLSIRQGDIAGALPWFERAAAAAPQDAALLVRFAEAQLAAGDADAARSTLAQALTRDPGHAAALALQQRLR